MPKERPEDHLLDDTQFRRLNKTFYASEPADYFEQRLHLLALAAGNREGMYKLLSEGVTVGSLKLAANLDPDDASGERAAQHYVATESELLSHQIGETLLRLYLAHEYSGRLAPKCPRLDLARLRHGSDLVRRLESRFVKASIENEANRRAIAKVFHLTERRETFEHPPDEEVWNRSLLLHERYLRHFAAQYLQGGSLYNAAKHGLALAPQEQAGVEFAGILKRTGPAILYLAVKSSPSEPIPRWWESLHFVESDEQMVFIYRAITQLRMLWRVARFRYVDKTATGLEVGIMGGPTPEDLLAKRWPTDQPMLVNDLSFQLRYWRPKRQTTPPSDMSPAERVAARIEPIVPAGWRLLAPETFDGGWRLRIENIEDPILSVAVWNEDLDEALDSFEHSVRTLRA